MTDLLPKPMLAETPDDYTKLRYPLLASTKLDGIRCMLHPHPNKSVDVSLPMTRSLKPIPNKHISSLLSTLPAGLDGEIGTIVDGAIDFRTTSGNVMRAEGAPEFEFYVFDNWLHNAPFQQRYDALCKRAAEGEFPDFVKVLSHGVLEKHQDINPLFELALASGNEGLILRDPKGTYKHGRSRVSEQGMLKVKPWMDHEGICVDIIEEQKNNNVAEKNELGRTKRSSAKAGKVGKGRMGVMVLEAPEWKGTFEITGFTDADKAKYWANPPIGKLIKFKYLGVGGYDKPRHGTFLGERDVRDTSN